MADRPFDTPPVVSDFLTLDANFEAFIASSEAIAIKLVFGESVSIRFNVDWVGTTDDIEISVLTGHQISNGNTLDGFTSTTDVELDTGADSFSADKDMNGTYIAFTTSGNNRGQMRLITDSVASDDGVILDHAVTGGDPASGNPYALYRLVEQKFTIPYVATAEDDPGNDGVTVNWMSGEFVLVRAQRLGSADAQRIQMSYQKDSGPA